MPRPLTRAEMRELDRRAIEVAGIPAAALMENAGRAVADHAARLARGGPIALLCGHGSNGGDGFVAARHLDNRGLRARVVALQPERLEGAARANFDALAHTGAGILTAAPADADAIAAALAGAAVIVDALFGTGLSGPLRDPWPALISRVNDLGLPILAVDIPSGLDADTGEPLGAALHATRTVTMHAPKVGFTRGRGAEFTGEVVVADIGIPSKLV